MTRGGKRKNQTGRPKKPYRVKRMSVPEHIVDIVQYMIEITEKGKTIEAEIRYFE